MPRRGVAPAGAPAPLFHTPPGNCEKHVHFLFRACYVTCLPPRAPGASPPCARIGPAGGFFAPPDRPGSPSPGRSTRARPMASTHGFGPWLEPAVAPPRNSRVNLCGPRCDQALGATAQLSRPPRCAPPCLSPGSLSRGEAFASGDVSAGHHLARIIRGSHRSKRRAGLMQCVEAQPQPTGQQPMTSPGQK